MMMTENERHTQFDRAITRLAEELGDEWSVSISDRSTHFSQWWGATLSGPGQAAVRVRRLDCERWRMSAEYPPKTGPYGVPSITQTMTRPAVKLAGDLRRRLIDIYLPDLAQALEAAAIADARDDVARGVVDDMEALLPGTYVSDRNAGSHRLRPDLHARWTRQGDVPLSVALHSRANYGAVLTVDGLDPAQARAALEFVARLVQSPPDGIRRPACRAGCRGRQGHRRRRLGTPERLRRRHRGPLHRALGRRRCRVDVDRLGRVPRRHPRRRAARRRPVREASELGRTPTGWAAAPSVGPTRGLTRSTPEGVDHRRAGAVICRLGPLDGRYALRSAMKDLLGELVDQRLPGLLDPPGEELLPELPVCLAE